MVAEAQGPWMRLWCRITRTSWRKKGVTYLYKLPGNRDHTQAQVTECSKRSNGQVYQGKFNKWKELLC